MKKISFIPKERIDRFSTDNKETALAYFLSRYMQQKQIERVLKYFDTRTDIRYICDGKFASIIPYKDEVGNIRDVKVIIIDPNTGDALGYGDTRSMAQQTKKQNRKSGYYLHSPDCKSWSVADELSKGYDFQRHSTLFGLDKAFLSENNFKEIYIVNKVSDVIKMTAILPFTIWIAVEDEKDLLDPSIATLFEGRKVRFCPEIDTNQRILKMACSLIKNGAKVRIENYSTLPNLHRVISDVFDSNFFNQPKEPSMVTISTLVLDLLKLGVSHDYIATLLDIEQCTPY